jgi:hypothetical protein
VGTTVNPLFAKVVAATGISELFAAHALARACERAGVDPTKLSPASLRAALPEIEKTVGTFCHGERDDVMAKLQALTR